MPERHLVSARRRATTLLSLGLLLSAAAAQQFAPQPIAQGDFGARAPNPIDLDGDGDPDFVGLVANGSVLRHWRNLGGARCAMFASSSGRGLNDFLDRRTAAADFDGDGDNDLLMTTGASVGVLLLQNRLARFADPPIALPAINNALVTGVRVLDADRDGDADVLVRSATALGMLLNDGTGNFTVAPATMLPASTGNTIVEVADLDGDGASDLVVADNSAPALWMARTGGFVDESATRLPAGTPVSGQVVIDDVDNDGDRDLINVATQTPVTVLLLRNTGSGVFNADPNAFVGTPGLTAPAVAADLDGDGDRDVAVGRFLFVNDGAGRFTAGNPLSVAPVAVVDLDGDRFLDVLTVNDIVRNDGGRGLVELRRCYGLVTGDLDRDGDRDVIGANGSSWIVEGSRHDWRATATSATITTSLVDLDGDGDADLIERTNAAVSLFGNDGTGTFTRVLLSQSQSLLAGLPAVFDLDRDGDPDLAWGVGTFGASSAVVMRNNGNLTFTDVTAATLPPGTRFMPSVVGADLDADGYDDLVVASLTGAMWLRNRGNNTLENASARLAPGFGGEVIRAVQLDRDPELELLAVRNPTLLLFDRVGTDWVDVSTQLPGSAGPATNAVALDFDTDGDLDLAVAGGGGFLLANDGNGRFTDVTAGRGPFTATAFTAFDADGDGDPDLLDGLDLWVNQERQLAVAAPVAVGGQLVVEFVAQPGFGVGAAVCIVTLGLQRSAAGLPLFGGTLFPEPSSSVILGTAVSALGTPGQRSVPVPNNPLLRGQVLQIQGLVIGTRGDLALANHVVATID